MSVNQTYKILIVEDEQAVVETLISTIKKFPEFEYIGHTDNEYVALELIKSKTPDFVLIDIDINVGNGLSLMRHIRSDAYFKDNSPYLVAVTSFSSSQKRNELKQWADDVYIKSLPLHLNDLFIRLSFVILEKNSIQQMIPSQDISTLILEFLERCKIKPKSHLQKEYLVHLITQYHQHSVAGKDFKSKDLLLATTNHFNLKNPNHLNTKIDRLIKEIYTLTSSEILNELSDYFTAAKPPSILGFLDILSQYIKNQSTN